jgi:uncharacterized cupredoxin-like copper-binding protein
MMRSTLLALVVVGVVLVAACSSAPETLPADVQVTVDMKEYSVTITPGSIKAGTIKFGIRNVGTMEHEFEIIKTDLAADKLPTDVGSGKAKEDGLVKQIKSILPNKVATITADLQAGSYVIICNVSGHYQLGMRAAFKVD